MSYIINQNVPVGSALDLLGSLSDVNISNPSNGDCIVYNSTTGKWENSDDLSTLNSALNQTITRERTIPSTSIAANGTGTINLGAPPTISGYTLKGGTANPDKDLLSVSYRASSGIITVHNFHSAAQSVSGSVVDIYQKNN